MTTEKGSTDPLTVPKAAKEIGVHFSTIYRWIEAESIAYFPFGGIIFIPACEVRRLVGKRNQEGGELETKKG